ncbi:hypothetical protein EMCRGX_G004247 [Ephydatia muelleri]
MNGLQIPDTPIVVDYWRQKDVPPRSLFFLTHIHADHITGLTASWSSTIYCTPITCKLLINKIGIQPSVVEALEVGQAHLLKVDCPGDDTVCVCVTVLDANHCPGAAMFLFEGYFGTILYTGDFRYSPNMAATPLLSGKHVDILYLDNTYCHESCVFPSREEAGDSVIRLIRSLPEGTRVVIGLYYVGKEELLVKMGVALRRPIGVDVQRMELLRLLEARNVFTTEEDEADIVVCNRNSLTERSLELANEDTPTIGILPTCLHIGTGAPPPPSSNHIRVVPYSDHSSFLELCEFVGVVRPRHVIPLVRRFHGSSDLTRMRTDMSVFDHLLDLTPRPPIHVPLSIQRLLSKDPGVLLGDPPPRPKRRRSSYPTPPPLIKLNQQRPMGVQYLSPVKSKASPRASPPPGSPEPALPTEEVVLKSSDQRGSHFGGFEQNGHSAPKQNGDHYSRGPPALVAMGEKLSACTVGSRSPPPLHHTTSIAAGSDVGVVAGSDVGVVAGSDVGVVSGSGITEVSGTTLLDTMHSHAPDTMHSHAPDAGVAEADAASLLWGRSLYVEGGACMLQISKVESCHTSSCVATSPPTPDVPATSPPTPDVPATSPPTPDVPATSPPTPDVPATSPPTPDVPATSPPTPDVPATSPPTPDVPATSPMTHDVPATSPMTHDDQSSVVKPTCRSPGCGPRQQAPPLLDVREFPYQQAYPLDVRESPYQAGHCHQFVRKARRLPASILSDEQGHPHDKMDTNEQGLPHDKMDTNERGHPHQNSKQLPISLFTRTLGPSGGSGLVTSATPPHNHTDTQVPKDEHISDREKQSPDHSRFVLTCQCASGGVCWVGLEDFLFSLEPHPSDEDGDFLNWV